MIASGPTRVDLPSEGIRNNQHVLICRPFPMSTIKKLPKLSKRWHLYIVRCSDDTLYTGITNNVDRRIAMHNSGTASRYTRSRRPVALIYQERCRDRSSALRKEFRMKALSRLEKERYITRPACAATRGKRKT